MDINSSESAVKNIFIRNLFFVLVFALKKWMNLIMKSIAEGIVGQRKAKEKPKENICSAQMVIKIYDYLLNSI